MTSHRFLKLANKIACIAIEVTADNAIAETLHDHAFTHEEISQIKSALQEIADEHTTRSQYHAHMEVQELRAES